MPQDALTTWQFVLRLAAAVLVVVGFARLLRRSRSTKRGFAVAAIILGIVGLALTRTLTESSSHRLSGNAPRAETTIHAEVSDRAFDSQDLPAVKLEAPSGWRIEFDSANGVVAVVQGSDPIATAKTVFQINSSTLSNDADLDRILAMASKGLEDRGMTKGDSFSETIDGFPARGRVLRGDTDDSCLWFVKRGPRFVSALICRSRSPTNAREACNSVLDRLKWRELVPN
jgi:hypothetical protein